ncbi:hypothetical protein NHF50_01420 [Flavobacterium sp. NRK F10]|uniref:DUF6705 family protein n=1 Tax=Flavobacterium sp. NRK F10 TaxID=2954931 RepID=UPI002091D45C|nr:DUF6705 family protein [Flavobacterium sp. NRK F10]MCO6173696.1 hypothetical protein [Flavobacterium sp. NRK F10]
MKNILTFLALLSMSLLSAQTIVPLSSATPDDYFSGNTYIKDINGMLDPFVGTWQWTDGTNTFTIKFVKKTQWNPQNFNPYTKDVILGSYKNIQNGVVTYDHLNFSTEDADFLTENYATIITSYDSPTILNINMTDKEKNKKLSGYFYLQYDPNLTAVGQVFTAKLEVHPMENRFSSPNAQPVLSGYSFPYTMILTKME